MDINKTTHYVITGEMIDILDLITKINNTKGLRITSIDIHRYGVEYRATIDIDDYRGDRGGI